MLKTFLFTILLLCFSAPLFAQKAGKVEKLEKIKWKTNFAAAEKEAKLSGKPLLLDFTAVWCVLCRSMDVNFWTRADVVGLAKHFVAVKIDGEKEPLIAKRFGVEGFPTVVLADSWGTGFDSHAGFGQNSDRVILTKAAAFPKDFKPLVKSGKALEKKPDDTEALSEFAAFYGARNLHGLSTAIYKRLLKIETDPSKREAALLNLALDSLKIGRPSESLGFYETLLADYPKSPQADVYQYGIFISHLRKGNYAEAEKHLTKLKIDFPDSKTVGQAEQALEKQKALKK